MAGRLRHALDMLVGGNVPVTFSPDQEDIPMTTPDQRAHELLNSILSPAEARCLRDTGYVLVTAKSGRRYRVSAHDVYEMDSNTGTETVAHLCVVPKIAGIPEGDKLLAKYLMIKGNEDAFRMKAIRHDYRNPFAEEWWQGLNGIARQEPFPRGLFEGMTYNEPPPQRRAVQRIRFTQNMDIRHIPDWAAYNYGLPPNVRANPERNTVVYEGVEYRILNQTIENDHWFGPIDTRTVTLEVEPVNQPVGRWTDGGRYMPEPMEELARQAAILRQLSGDNAQVDWMHGTVTLELGWADGHDRIRRYVDACHASQPIELYGQQWRVTDYEIESAGRSDVRYTFSLVRR